jgi:cytochrome c-type biogenesis protein CcmH
VRVGFAAAALVVLSLTGVGAARAQSGQDAALDARVRTFARQVRCLVCQNETLADSQAGLAADLRQEIREQMMAGRSDEEIKAFLTERYGDFVLYRPPFTARTWALWIGPFALAGVGFALLGRHLKRRPAVDRRHGLDPRARQRIRRLLDAPDRALTDSPTREQAVIAVYRRHLAELKSDVREGTLADEPFALEREELEARLAADLAPYS